MLAPFWLPMSKAALTVALTDYLIDNTQEATETWAAVDIGAAPANGRRRFVVAIMQHRNFTATTNVSSVTIGGSAATSAVHMYSLDPTDSSGRLVLTIHYREIPAGTTTNIVWNWTGSGARNNCMKFCYVVESGPGGIEVIDTAEYIHANDGSFNLDVNVVRGGVTIANAGANNITGHTWTNVTEDHDEDANTDDWHSVASAENDADETLAVSVVQSSAGSPFAPMGAAVSFGPL